MITAVDDFMLDRCQRLSDWFHAWTGLDCLLQSRGCAGFAAIFLVFGIAQDAMSGKAFSWASALLLLSNVTTAFWELPDDMAARKAAGEGFRNPTRVEWRTQRVLTSALIAGSLTIAIVSADVPFAGWLVSTLLRDLLRACDVQTPRQSRIRMILKAPLSGLRPQPVTVMEVR